MHITKYATLPCTNDILQDVVGIQVKYLELLKLFVLLKRNLFVQICKWKLVPSALPKM